MAHKRSLEDIMAVIQGLLAKADSTEFEAEAKEFRRKAEELMEKYRIEESQMEATGESVGITPTQYEFDLYPEGSPFATSYQWMISSIVHHTECRAILKYRYREGVMMVTIELTGYMGDMRYAELLYQSARLVFADRMEPSVDPTLSDQENVYKLRRSGMPRSKVSVAMGWGDRGPANAKVSRLYEAACKERGESADLKGRGTSVRLYRKGFAEEFGYRLSSRLREARESRSELGVIVLADRKTKVDEAFYAKYPSLRPDPNYKPKSRKAKPVRWTKADERRYTEMQSGSARAGSSAGRRAADEIDVGGVARKRSVES